MRWDRGIFGSSDGFNIISPWGVHGVFMADEWNICTWMGDRAGVPWSSYIDGFYTH